MKKFIPLGEVKIPADEYASQGNAILGIRDSGKTYTATYIAERLLDAGIPFVAFDPIGIWKYLRVPGKGKGYPVVVAGGRNGDLPLTPESAPEIVRAAMRENVALVIDLYDIHLSKADWRSIVQKCVRLLLYENGDYGLRHIFLEEAAEFAPQKVMDGITYAEIEKLGRMGGNSMLGYTLINQRSEEVNKAVLELCDSLFLHRQKGRNSLTALGKWLDIGDVAASREIIKSLPMLPQGECWAWLSGSNTPVHVHVPQKQTFHPNRRALTQATAKRDFEALDVTSFVQKLSTSLEKYLAQAKDNDPAEMRKRIAQLQKQLAARPTEVQTVERVVEREVPVVGDEQLASLRDIVRNLNEVAATASSIAGDIADALQKAKGTQKTLASVAPRAALPAPAPAARPVPPQDPGDPSALSNPQQRILGALKSFEAAGITQVRRETVAVWAGASPTSGSYMGNLSTLRTLGMVDYPVVGELSLTAAGRQRAGTQSAPTLAAFQDRWKTAVTGPQGRILAALIEAYPQALGREALAQNVGASVTSGSFAGNLSKLRTLGAIEYQPNGLVGATALLFPALEREGESR